MDPLEDTLQRLREAFHAGRTRPAEFRAAQLRGLGCFLQENKQLLHDALAQDLHKVGWGWGYERVHWGRGAWRAAGTAGGEDTCTLHEAGLKAAPPLGQSHPCTFIQSLISVFMQQLFAEHLLCARYCSRLWGYSRE